MSDEPSSFRSIICWSNPGRMVFAVCNWKKPRPGGRLLCVRFVCPEAHRDNHVQAWLSVRFVLKYRSYTPPALVTGAQTVKAAVLLVSAILSHKSFVSKIWARKAGLQVIPTPTARTESRAKTSREHFTIQLYLSETLVSMFITPLKKKPEKSAGGTGTMAGRRLIYYLYFHCNSCLIGLRANVKWGWLSNPACQPCTLPLN